MGFQGSFSFPANPVINQTYDHGGKTYKWTGIGWRQITPAGQLIDPPGLELIASGSANNVANIDFVLTSFTSQYRGFLWRFARFVPVTDAVGLMCRFSTDGGVTYDTAAASYDWAYGHVDSDSALFGIAGNASDTDIHLMSSTTFVIGNGTTEGVAFLMELWKPTSQALWNRLSFRGYYISSVATPSGRVVHGGGAREAAQDTDAIRLLFTSGNISTLDYAMFGWT